MAKSGDGKASAPGRDNQLLALIPRWRSLFFILIGLMIVSAFNGQWRIGRDSAAYRKLGHQLAVTGKYNFRDKSDAASYSDQQDIRYPGMPLLLAGVERVFGRSDTAAVLAVTLMAIATLLLTYRLVRPIVPLWVAIAVGFWIGGDRTVLEPCQAGLNR